jgi:hypothetical protein
MEALNHIEHSSPLNPALRMNDIQTKRPRLAPTLAIVAACIGLFSACGIGGRNNYVPPPPPPLAPIDVSPHTLTFNLTPVGSTSPAQQLTLKNTSAQPIVIEGIRLSITDSFTKTTDCGHQLAAGQSCTIAIAFNPQSEGSMGAQINVFSLGFQHLIVLLHGTATPRPQPPQNTPPS